MDVDLAPIKKPFPNPFTRLIRPSGYILNEIVPFPPKQNIGMFFSRNFLPMSKSSKILLFELLCPPIEK
jgi:hypothetical protein